jgi:anti-sigma regulatory factor (Ser/Thr protein kinase)
MALEESFDAGTLPGLRQAVLTEAVAAGLAGERADDVVLAVHELAANAVRHGGGSGRLWMLSTRAGLRCQVSDDGPGSGHADAAGRPWPVQHGHGLWLVTSLADQVSIAPGPAGSAVTITFGVPEAGRGQSEFLAARSDGLDWRQRRLEH